MVEIDLEDEVDRWAWTCPIGHRSWEPTNHHFWCQQCAQSYADDVDPEFDELRDDRSNETVTRDEVRLVRGSDAYQDVRGGKA